MPPEAAAGFTWLFKAQLINGTKRSADFTVVTEIMPGM